MELRLNKSCRKRLCKGKPLTRTTDKNHWQEPHSLKTQGEGEGEGEGKKWVLNDQLCGLHIWWECRCVWLRVIVCDCVCIRGEGGSSQKYTLSPLQSNPGQTHYRAHSERLRGRTHTFHLMSVILVYSFSMSVMPVYSFSIFLERNVSYKCVITLPNHPSKIACMSEIPRNVQQLT